jgi:hypothetical protein
MPDNGDEDNTIQDFPSFLRGYGNQPLKKPRGFRGSKLGPANEGRRLSPEEIGAFEAQLKRDGKL